MGKERFRGSLQRPLAGGGSLCHTRPCDLLLPFPFLSEGVRELTSGPLRSLEPIPSGLPFASSSQGQPRANS